jgi:hypothetical protein
MSYFTDEELRLLGEKYLEAHPDLEAAIKAERAKEQAANPATIVQGSDIQTRDEVRENHGLPAADNTDGPAVAANTTEAYKNEADASIAIVYPVSWPSPTEDVPNPHSTLIFLGNVADATFTKDDLKTVLKTFIWEPFDVALGEVKMFGENNDVPVVTLLGEQLTIIRQTLEEELAKYGIKDASEHNYSPHITVDPQSMQSVPLMSVRLGKPQIWWGTERG